MKKLDLFNQLKKSNILNLRFYKFNLASVFLLIGGVVFGQNAIIGSGFTAGWGGACSSNSQFEYFTSSAGTSYISTQNTSGTGNQYFRLGIDWSGTIAQNTITVGSDVLVTPGTEYTLNSTCTTSGAMYVNSASTSHNYIFKTKDAGPSPSRQFICFLVQGTVQTVSTVTRNFTTVFPGLSPTITANLSGSLATGQGVYLRYSTDNFSTSTIVAMSGSGSTYTASIPTQVTSTTVKYYVFTSGSGLSPTNAKADWYTINSNNNSGSNYSYTVTAGNNQYRSLTTGNWNSTSTWQVGNGTEWANATSTPTSSDGAITILTEHNVTASASVSIDETTVNSGGTLTVSSGQTLTIANGTGTDLTINGTVISSGTITYTGSTTIVNGTLRNAGTSTGAATTTLTFSSTGTYEHNTGSGGVVPTATWNATSNCRIISSGTTLPTGLGQNFGNFEWANSTHGSTNVQMSAVMTSIQGNFTVSNTGTGTLRYNANSPPSPTFAIGGNLVISGGTFDVSSGSSTPTFNVSGNFTQSGGTLTETGSGNGRISFVKSSGNQTFSKSSGTIANTINWNVGNGTSTNTVELATSVNIGTGSGTFSVLNNATFDAKTYVLSGSGASTFNAGATIISAHASGINGSITLSGTRTYNASTNYTFNGSLAQVTGASITAANNITLSNSNGLTLSANTSITGTLTLTSGKLTTNGFTLVLSNAVSGASSSNYINADATGTATFNGVSTARVFPLGTASAYAPMTVTAGSSTNYTAYVTASFPCSATDASKMVNLAWGLSGSNTPSQVVFQWPASSQAVSFTPASSCDLGRYNASCPYNVTNIGAAAGSGPYTLTTTSGLSSTNNNYVIGNQNAIYIVAPTITTTVAASSITNSTASSGGETITGSSITSKGVVWNTSTAPTVALSTKTNDGTGTANFTSSITSLSPETLYYLRAYATNAAGTAYGDEKTFRTLSNPATAQASSLSATATSSSNIDLTWSGATFPLSGASNKGYILLRAVSPNSPSLGNSNGSAPSAGSNTTIVSSVIADNATSFSNSGLAASTQYNYLLIPYTWNGTNASTYNYLTTSAPTANATTQSGSTPPVLTTTSASALTASTATLNGDITSDGGGSVTARGFVYSTSDATPTIGEGGVTDQASGSGTGVFNATISSLTSNTTYYYQAYATNTSGTSYGGVISFTTLKAEPSTQATSLVFSSVTTTSFNTAFTAAAGNPDGYIVIRSTSASLSTDPIDGTTYNVGNSFGGGTVVSVGSTISGISNTSLAAGATYYTFVFAYNNSGSSIDYLITSPLSSSTITLTDAPATPTFSSVATSGFTVNWSATTGASSYRLDVSTVSNFASYVSGYQDLTVATNSQVVTGLTANTLYYARVRAVNSSGTSANSISANSETLSNAPTVGIASSISTSGLTANWTAPGSQGAVTFTYTIELSTVNDFSSITSTVSSIASGTTTNAFTSLSEGTDYYYRIKAVNSAGSSAWSSVSAAVTTLTSSISLNDLGTAVTQNFDAMAATTTLPSGWRMHASTSSPTWGGASSTVTNQASSGSPTAGGTYNWGTSASERAVGAMSSGSFASPSQLLVFTKNNTGSTITNFSISYTAERYRRNSASASVKFYYSTNGTSWTEVTDGEIASSNFPTGGNAFFFSEPLEVERSFVISGLTINSNDDFYFRWDINTTGSNSQGIGIDDVSIKPCGTVSAPAASNQSFCSAASPTVAGLTATGSSIQWYSASSGGTALNSSTALTNSTTYYASQTVGGCESISRTAVVATINTNPTAPTGDGSQSFCSGLTVASLSATGSSIQWYAAASGGSALSSSTSLANGITYYATQTTNNCESTTRLAVTVLLISSGTWLGNTSTDWNTASNWCGGVPTSSTNVVINSGASNYPNLSSGADGVANSITINSGGSLTISGTETLTITSGGSFTNNGTFTASSGTSVLFAGSGSITGTVTFNNLTTSGTLTPSTTTTINGILTLNSGGTISTNSPIFGSASTLNYNYGGGFGGKRNQSTEWPSSNGPVNLTITNGSWIQLTGDRSISGNVTITNGALQASGGRTLTMNGTTQSITVSTTSGGAIYGTDNGFGNDLSLNISNGSTTTFTGDATSSNDDEKKFIGITVSSGGALVLARGILCKYGTFTVNGTLRINANGYIQSINGVAPSYGSSSTLVYSSGGSYGRGFEWSATSGAGYPNNIQVSSNTTLNVNNGANVARQIAGNLTIDAGSTLSLESMTSGSFEIGLAVIGNISNSGIITLATSTERLKCVNFTNNNGSTANLSSNGGGDLEVTGNLLDNGTFTSNNRAVFFSGTGVQDVSGSGTFNIDYVVSNKASGTIRMLTNLLVEGPNGGNALTLTNSTDILDLNGFTLTLGKASVTSGVTGNGSFCGSASSSLSILGTGSLGTLRFDLTTPGTTNVLQNLTLNRTATGIVTLANNLNVNNSITLTDGSFVLGSNTLNFSGSSISRTSGSIDATNASSIVVFTNSSALTLPVGLFMGGSVSNLTVNGGGLSIGEDIQVPNTLTMTAGNINFSAGELEIGSGIANPGSVLWTSGTVLGPLKRWFGTAANSTQASGIFPVGLSNQNRLAIINFTQATAGGYILMEYKTGAPSNSTPSNPFGLPMSYVIDGQTNYIQNADLTGYWDITPYSSAGIAYDALDNNTFDITLRINSDVIQANPVTADPPGMRIIRAKGNPNLPHDPFEIGATTATIQQVPGSDPGTDFYVRSNSLTGFSWFNIGGDNETRLPVELLSFTGNCSSDQTQLIWKTASENNSNFFEVLKSQDGENWRVINTQAAAGFSSTLQTYSFVETEKSNGAYYRLNQVDFNGDNKLYDPIFVDCEGNTSQLNTYPNPSKDGFNIAINDSKFVGESTLIIRDAMGKVVLTKSILIAEGMNLFPIASNEIENGVYFITILNENDNAKTIKHVKN